MRAFRIDHDLFFINEPFLDAHRSQLKHCLIIPMEEFTGHSSYRTVHSASNHSLWLVRCDLVIVTEGGWYEAQPAAFQQALFQETASNGSTFVDGQRPITINYWEGLSAEEQRALIQKDDEPPCAPYPERLAGYEHLKAYHGVFPSEHGANCFASVLYAISRNAFIIHEWVHQKTFMLFLQNAGYQRVDGKAFRADDVICFLDEGKLVHACYAVSETHCFNKNGQTFWEACSIVEIDSIRKNFEGLEQRILRRKSP